MIFKLAGCAVCVALIALFLKSRGSEYGMLLSVCAGITLIIPLSKYIADAVGKLLDLSEKFAVPETAVSVMIKVLGIAFIVEAACDICADCGENALCTKVNICGKFMMLAAAFPVFTELSDILASFTKG